MQLPKSSHDLGADPLTNRRTSRRQSRPSRNLKELREWEFKISNPFHDHNQQNYLPQPILSQIQHLEYISSKSIKNIEIPQCRRPSNFMKNLQMMQQLAKIQEQKYSGMLKEGCLELGRKKNLGQLGSNQNGISWKEEDDISLQLNGFYDYRERVEDDFNLFEENSYYNDGGMEEQKPYLFYSNKEIEQCQMEEEVNNYLR